MKYAAVLSVATITICTYCSAQTSFFATAGALVRPTTFDFPNLSKDKVQLFAYQKYIGKVTRDTVDFYVIDDLSTPKYHFTSRNFEGSLHATLQTTVGSEESVTYPTFSEQSAFITTYEVDRKDGLNPATQANLYEVDLRDGSIKKLLSYGEQFVVLGGLWRSPANPEGRGYVAAIGTPVAKADGKYFLQIIFNRLDSPGSTAQFYELELSGSNKILREIRTFHPERPNGGAARKPDGSVYFHTIEITLPNEPTRSTYLKRLKADRSLEAVIQEQVGTGPNASSGCGIMQGTDDFVFFCRKNTKWLAYLIENGVAKGPFEMAQFVNLEASFGFAVVQATAPSLPTQTGFVPYWPRIALWDTTLKNSLVALTSEASIAGARIGNFYSRALAFDCQILAGTENSRSIDVRPVSLRSSSLGINSVTFTGCNLSFPGTHTEIIANGKTLSGREISNIQPQQITINTSEMGGDVIFSVRLHHATGVVTSLNSLIVKLPSTTPPPRIDALTSVFAEGGVDRPASIVAPGGMAVSLWGEGFAANGMEFSHASASPPRHELGGVRVLVDTEPIAILYVGPRQINAIMPSRLSVGIHRIQVERSIVSGTSIPMLSGRFEVNSTPSAPSLVTYAPTGVDYRIVAALRPDGTLVGPQRPVSPSEILSIFGTGFGEKLVDVSMDSPLASTPLRVPPKCSLNGHQDLTILYAGMTLFPGLDQMNFQIPGSFITSSSGTIGIECQFEQSTINFMLHAVM